MWDREVWLGLRVWGCRHGICSRLSRGWVCGDGGLLILLDNVNLMVWQD